ncbi:MAG: aminoglycoside phosphotransferase family protein [Pseudomonadota bacterium]
MATQSHTREFLIRWLVTEGFSENVSVTLLLGDGSSRCFYRVQEVGSQASYILISDPEWKQTKDYPPHQKALQDAKIPVPVFRKAAPHQGLLLMQDLGDELLQHRIQKEPKQKEAWLSKAVCLLADLHGKLYPVSKELPASERRFDETKLFEELCFTLEHLREKYLGLSPLRSQDLKAIKNYCGVLGALSPEVFCHRDYHCRNLLVHENQLWMIDFQDARLGPPGYDLASLVFDAYVPISKDTRQDLISVYLKTLEAYPLRKAIRETSFEKDLYLLAYQRTLKAAGSFASFWTRFQKSTHLAYIEEALTLAKSIEALGLIPNDVTSAFEIDTLLKTLHEKKPNS